MRHTEAVNKFWQKRNRMRSKDTEGSIVLGNIQNSFVQNDTPLGDDSLRHTVKYCTAFSTSN